MRGGTSDGSAGLNVVAPWPPPPGPAAGAALPLVAASRAAAVPAPGPAAAAGEFTNPVIWQDFADIDVIRVGDTY